MFVKRPCRVIFGVNGERTNPGDIRSLQRALHRVLEQPGAEAVALPGCRNSQPSQQHDGNGVTGKAFNHSRGCSGIFNLTDHQRIVANHSFTGDGNVGLRSFRLLVLERISNEKPVESLTPAIEFIHDVAALQLFNPEGCH